MNEYPDTEKGLKINKYMPREYSIDKGIKECTPYSIPEMLEVMPLAFEDAIGKFMLSIQRTACVEKKMIWWFVEYKDFLTNNEVLELDPSMDIHREMSFDSKSLPNALADCIAWLGENGYLNKGGEDG